MFSILNINSKNSLGRLIIYLISSNALNYLILFIVSILIFRNVDRTHYGLYVLIGSVFAISELLMAGFNQAIDRYMKEDIPKEDKQQIILLTAYYKYTILILFLITLVIMGVFGLERILIAQYEEVKAVFQEYLLMATINGILTIMLGISQTILVSLYHYKFVNNLSILKSIVYLISVMILINLTDNYFYYLIVNTILTMLLFVIVSQKIYSAHNEYSFFTLFNTRVEIRVFKNYLIPYSAPLTGTSILTYVKNHLPIILLGKEFTLEDVALFSILKNFFKNLHSLSSSFLGQLTSRLIELKNNTARFIVAINILYYGSYIARIFVYLIFVLLVEYFFILFKINDSYESRMIFYILGLEYVIAGLASVYGVLFSLESKTLKLFYASGIRFFIETILIFLILPHYGAIGAAIILLISRSSETIVFYLMMRSQKTIKYPILGLVILLPFVIYFILKVFNE